MTPCPKIPYRSRDEAERARRAINLVPWFNESRRPPYLCRTCGHWHLTTSEVGEAKGDTPRSRRYLEERYAPNPFDRKKAGRKRKVKPKLG